MKKNTIITLCIIFVIIMTGCYLIINSRIKAQYEPNYLLEDFYVKPERKMNVNEYKVVKVEENEMVEIYFNTYISLLLENFSLAYAYLDEESQLEQFPNLDSFRNKVSHITNSFSITPKIDRYDLKTEDDKKIYTISDKNGNIYEFQVDAVMKYTVSFK